MQEAIKSPVRQRKSGITRAGNHGRNSEVFVRLPLFGRVPRSSACLQECHHECHQLQSDLHSHAQAGDPAGFYVD
jgi:hypothetical protein